MAPLAAALLALAPVIAAAEVPLNGITIGMAVGSLGQSLGPPINVISDDSGNRFVFADGTSAYADDDGVVLAVQTQRGTPRIDVDGTPRAFRIGSYTAARADAELANVAEFATPALRSYRLAPRRDLVFAFSPTSQRLERVTYGEPGQLARLGLLSGDSAAKTVAYRAPRLRGSTGATSITGPQTVVYRIAIDRAGSVTAVDIVMSSAIPAGDDEITRRLRKDRYLPATLGGRPIAATIFVELHR